MTVPAGYPAYDHPVRKMVMGAPPGEVVPPLEMFRASQEAGYSADFDGGRMARQMMEPPAKEPTLEQALARVSKEIIARAQDVTEETKTLVVEFESFKAKLCALVQARDGKRTAALQQEWQEVYQQCRAALDLVEELKRRSAGLQGRLHEVEQRRSKARADLNAVFASRPTADMFPTLEEYRDHQKEVDSARGVLHAIEAEYSAEQRRFNALGEELREAQVKLSELKTTEEDLRAQLTGEPRTHMGVELAE